MEDHAMADEEKTADNPKTPLLNSGRDVRGRFTNGNALRFQLGQSGNPRGRPASANLSDAYRRRLKERIGRGDNTRSWADEIARQLVDAAVAGDVAAAREIADRTEGKPRQALDVRSQSTDIATQLQIHGLTIEDFERGVDDILNELHCLKSDPEEVN
jgi:hypothetical protein